MTSKTKKPCTTCYFCENPEAYSPDCSHPLSQVEDEVRGTTEKMCCWMMRSYSTYSECGPGGKYWRDRNDPPKEGEPLVSVWDEYNLGVALFAGATILIGGYLVSHIS